MADEKSTPQPAKERGTYRFVADHGENVVGDVRTMDKDDPRVLAGVVIPQK